MSNTHIKQFKPTKKSSNQRNEMSPRDVRETDALNTQSSQEDAKQSGKYDELKHECRYEDASLLCCIPAPKLTIRQVARGKMRVIDQKTILRSVDPTFLNFLPFLLGLVFVVAIELFYKEPFFNFTLSPDGVTYIQQSTSVRMKKFWLAETVLSGGKELTFLCIIGVIFCQRSKAFYYISIMSIFIIAISELKMIYHDPRPYMADPNGTIKPIECSKEFGNPSGHSMASSSFAITVFLDVFHGTPITTKANGRPSFLFQSYLFYNLCLFATIFWAVSIPYTRFVMGVHSLDQIVYGSSLGIWTGFFMHFYVRDNLIRYIEKISIWQEARKALRDNGLEMPQNNIESSQMAVTLREQAKREFNAEQDKFTPNTVAFFAFIAYIGFTVTAIETFTFINDLLTDSPKVEMWKANFTKGGCGIMDMTHALQNSGLNDAGWLTCLAPSFLFFVYGPQLNPCLRGQFKLINDQNSSSLFVYLARAIVAAPVAGILILIVSKIKLSTVGSPYIILFTNVIIPLLILGWYIFGGPYDYFTGKLVKCLRIKSED